ncbi:MAG: N-acetylmuramoyl-L-alanine amidase [Pseudomonadota bacterium]
MDRRASPNQTARTTAPDMVVIHYTGMKSAAAAVDWLCNPISKVSAHYLIDEDGSLVAMVDEDRRAWHAGVSLWDGVSDNNNRSIGIELHNIGHTDVAPEFAAAQIDALLTLMDGIRSRWTIPLKNVVAHSDIAPLRKIDPGERFPWHRLAQKGHALVVPPSVAAVTDGPSPLADFKQTLRLCGYGVSEGDGMDDLTHATIDAFHRRHLPHKVGAPFDAASLAVATHLARLSAPARAQPQSTPSSTQIDPP